MDIYNHHGDIRYPMHRGIVPTCWHANWRRTLKLGYRLNDAKISCVGPGHCYLSIWCPHPTHIHTQTYDSSDLTVFYCFKHYEVIDWFICAQCVTLVIGLRNTNICICIMSRYYFEWEQRAIVQVLYSPWTLYAFKWPRGRPSTGVKQRVCHRIIYWCTITALSIVVQGFMWPIFFISYFYQHILLSS